MALFAKKLEYWASPTAYLALLAIAKKKGGVPISFVVYRHWFCDGESGFQMRTFFTHKEARMALFYKTFFLPTTAWLHRVASGGSYEQFPKGVWVRVPVPRIGGRKRKKKPMQIGDLGRCYRIAKEEEEILNNDLAYIVHEISSLEENLDDDGVVVTRKVTDELLAEEASLRGAIDVARMRVNILHCEMEYSRSRRTGIPLSDTSFTNILLRAQEE